MKRIVSVVLVLVLIASVALAATVKLSINSGQKLEKQYEAFRSYLNDLSEKDRDAWMEELTSITEGSSSLFLTTESETFEQMVWIPKSGKKYHRTSGCSNMKNPIQVTITEAINGGYGRCSKCKP